MIAIIIIGCESNDFHEDLEYLAFRVNSHRIESDKNVLACEFYNLDADDTIVDLYVYPKSKERIDRKSYKYTIEVESENQDLILEDIARDIDYSCHFSYQSNGQTFESVEFDFKSEINDSPWEIYGSISNFSEQFHSVFSGNGSLYYFTGSPFRIYKFNENSGDYSQIEAINKHYFATHNGKPYFLPGNGGLLSVLDENDQFTEVKNLMTLISSSKRDFAYSYNDKIYYNNDEKVFSMDFNKDYEIEEVATLPFSHFGAEDRIYSYHEANFIYILVDEDGEANIYELNLDNMEVQYLTTYPGTGSKYFWVTGESGKIFVGGGAVDMYEKYEWRYEPENGDFWSFDFNTRTWSIEGYMPYSSICASSNVTQKDGKHYYISCEQVTIFKFISFDYAELD